MSEILTREEVESLIDREGACEPWEYRLLAHDAALRARVAELERVIAEAPHATFCAALREQLDKAKELLKETGSWAWFEGYNRLANAINNFLRGATDEHEIEYPFSQLRRPGPDDEPWRSETEEKLDKAKAALLEIHAGHYPCNAENGCGAHDYAALALAELEGK